MITADQNIRYQQNLTNRGAGPPGADDERLGHHPRQRRPDSPGNRGGEGRKVRRREPSKAPSATQARSRLPCPLVDANLTVASDWGYSVMRPDAGPPHVCRCHRRVGCRQSPASCGDRCGSEQPIEACLDGQKPPADGVRLRHRRDHSSHSHRQDDGLALSRSAS